MEYFTHVTALAALAVVAVHEILKLKVIPTTVANKYPVPTNILLSVIAALIVVWQSNVTKPMVWTGWVTLVATISVVAAVVYNQLLAKWTDLRSMEG
jgi:hypothetical protein